MSYVSVLKNIPELLSQPAGIAAIASVGIHGAIAFILPLMPVDSKPKQNVSPTSVGIMELSQAEQNRLPQKTGPQVSALPQVPLQTPIPLPNFATQPTALPKLPPNLDSTKVILPPLPRSSANPKISSLRKSPTLPVLPQPNFNNSFNAKTKSSSSYRRFDPNIKLGSPSPSASGKTRSTSRIPAPSRLPNVPPIQSAPLPPEITRNPVPLPLPPTTNPGMGINNNPVAINPGINNNTAVNQPRGINPNDFIAPTNGNIPKPGDSLSLAGQSVQQWGVPQSGSQKIELPIQPPASTQNTKIAPQNTTTLALAKQFEEVKQRFDNVENKPPISEVIKTKPGKEGKVEGTLVVDSDGKVDYFKFVDRKVSSNLKKATRNYFRRYIKQNRNNIRKNGTAKVYAFTLDFKSDAVKTVEFSKPEEKLVDRLRSSKKGSVQINQKPSKKKPGNISRSSVPIKIDPQPSRSTVVVPTVTSAPVKPKPQVEIRTKKPAVTSLNSDKAPVEVRLRNTPKVPPVPSLPKPQARVNIKEPAPQGTSKSSVVIRLRSGKEESESENNSKKSGSAKTLIQKLRKIQEQRENSN